MYKKIQFFFLLLAIAFQGKGQANMPLDRDFLLPYQSTFNNPNCNVFTNIMPYDAQKVAKAVSRDTIANYEDLLFKNNSPMLTEGAFSANIFPLAGGSGGYDAYAKMATYDYFGGLHIDGKLGSKFCFSGSYLAGNIYGPSFMDSIIERYKVVPGLGYAYGSPQTGYSYQYWDGYLSYSPANSFNFQIGKGKQFFGDGYRSLFLSDVSTSYPYFKITANLWRIEYVSMFTMMQDAETSTGLTSDFETKYSSFQYLSWNVSRRLNLSFFEAVTYDGDSGKNLRGPDLGYLNPILFYQSYNYNIGDPDKSNLGVSFKLKIARKEQFYGQVLIDEFKLDDVIHHTGWWGNKQGIQAGFKAFDLFGIKNMAFQTEVDYVRPYTYTARDPLQNYSNFNQPLADPEGANFIESATFLTYYYKNFLISAGAVVYYYGADSAHTDYGQNIFINYNEHPYNYGNYVGQGIPTYLSTFCLKTDFVISTKMNLKAELALYESLQRINSTYYSTPYITLGVRTSIGNLYNDFR